MSDDALAPPPSVDDLLARFETAPIERVQVGPEELGVERVGHFGLFRPEIGESSWPEWLAFARRQASAPLLRRSA